ncbi:hypothetical protein ACNKHW_07705 [Shigella flexneri]
MPLALPLIGPGQSVLPSFGVRVITALAICLVSCGYCIVRFMLLGIVPHGTVAGTGFTPTHMSVITRIMGLLLMALGIQNLSLLVFREFPACLINSFANETEVPCSVYSSLFLLCSRAVIKSKRNR